MFWGQPRWLSRMRIQLVIRRSWVWSHRVRQHSFIETDHEIVSMVILPCTDSRRAVVSFWWKNVHIGYYLELSHVSHKYSGRGWGAESDHIKVLFNQVLCCLPTLLGSQQLLYLLLVFRQSSEKLTSWTASKRAILLDVHFEGPDKLEFDWIIGF